MLAASTRFALLATLGLLGCATSGGDTSSYAVARATPIVNGADDRVEYSDVPEAAAERTLVKQASVALMRRENAERLLDGRLDELPRWGTLDSLCEGEPFAEQPAAAFCTGTLLDSDLVLTSNHCLQAQPFGSWVVVLDYFYEADGVLGVTADDVYEADAVVAAEERDPESGEGADYAWIRLRTPVSAPHAPARSFAENAASLALNQPLFNASAGGGVPIKLDFGASIRELRAPEYDYFVADTDTSHGSSGSPVFNQNLELLGVLVRGGADFVQTSEGCFRTAHADRPTEQYTHVGRAVSGLCGVAPEAAPCQRATPTLRVSGGACAFAAHTRPGLARALAALLACFGVILSRRRLRARLTTTRLHARTGAGAGP